MNNTHCLNEMAKAFRQAKKAETRLKSVAFVDNNREQPLILLDQRRTPAHKKYFDDANLIEGYI